LGGKFLHDAKINQAQHPIPAADHIFGLDVAVDNPLFMNIAQYR